MKAGTAPTAAPVANGKIAFLRGQNGPVDIYVMDANGSNPTRLTYSTGFPPPTVLWPALSPDGAKIAFSRFLFDYNFYDIYLMNADGSNEIRLTNSPGDDIYPDWSPDGTRNRIL